MKILRFGSTHGAPSRYLDLLRFNDIEKLVWLTHSGDSMVKRVFEECQRLNPQFSQKCQLVTYDIPSHINFINKIIQYVHVRSNRGSKFLNLAYPFFDFLVGLFQPKVISEVLERENFDFIWSGNNDSDNINILLWMLLKKNQLMPVIHSYQEHRCSYRIDEKKSINNATRLLLPSRSNLKSFEKTYSVNISDRTGFANEDWRSVELIDFINKNCVKKYSEEDGEPHVLILARFATFGTDPHGRRGSRINYLSIIETLVKRQVHVHLNCLKIVKSIENQTSVLNNPYELLQNKYPDYFHIDEVLNIDDWNSYLEIKKFDAGILHNVVDGEKINKFSHMNVPNRFFEYMISDVQPIILADKMADVESLINAIQFGIVGKDYDDVADILLDQVKSKNVKKLSKELKYKYSFENFIRQVINQYRSINTIRCNK